MISCQLVILFDCSNSLKLKLALCISSYLKAYSVFFCNDVGLCGGFEKVPVDVEVVHLTFHDSSY